jgi:alpha-1,3-glucosyltransferase
VLNIFYKLNKHFDSNSLIKLSLLFTIFGCFIPIYAIFKTKKLTKKICTQCFFVVSFAFYLFSFHVHEKTIIVPFLAYLINLPHMRNILPSFTLIGMFSLFPLLKRENQIIPYYFTCAIFYLICKQSMKLIKIKKNKTNENNENKNKNEENMFLLLEMCIFAIMIFYHFVDYNIPPPKQYPWFYPMINATFCFCYFFGVFLYSYYDLIMLVNKENLKYEKIKEKYY